MWLKLTRSLNCWRIRLRKHSSTQALEAKKHLPSGSKDSGAWPKLKRTWRWTAFILQCFPMTHFHLHPHPLTSPFFSWKYPCQCRQDVVWSTLQLPLLAPSSVIQPVPQSPAKTKSKPHSKSCCPYRYSQDHLNYWEEFKKPNNDEIATWLKNGRQGHKWRHKIALKHPWALRNLMSVQETTLVYAGSLLLKVYLDRLDSFQRVMPKGGNLLNNVNRMMETRHTSSWRGTERNILGHGAVAQPQTLLFQTVHHSIEEINSASMSLKISPPWPSRKHQISGTAEGLALTKHMDPKTSGSFHWHQWTKPNLYSYSGLTCLSWSSHCFRTTEQTWCHLHSAELFTSKTSWYCLSFTWTPEAPTCVPVNQVFCLFEHVLVLCAFLTHLMLPYFLDVVDVIY